MQLSSELSSSSERPPWPRGPFSAALSIWQALPVRDANLVPLSAPDVRCRQVGMLHSWPARSATNCRVAGEKLIRSLIHKPLNRPFGRAAHRCWSSNISEVSQNLKRREQITALRKGHQSKRGDKSRNVSRPASGPDSAALADLSLPILCQVAEIQEPHGGQEQATRSRSISVAEPYRKSVSNI